jgi:hypothetical protein
VKVYIDYFSRNKDREIRGGSEKREWGFDLVSNNNNNGGKRRQN